MSLLFIIYAAFIIAALLGGIVASLLELSHIRTTGNVRRRSDGFGP